MSQKDNNAVNIRARRRSARDLLRSLGNKVVLPGWPTGSDLPVGDRIEPQNDNRARPQLTLPGWPAPADLPTEPTNDNEP